jgi:hypothetical protein
MEKVDDIFCEKVIVLLICGAYQFAEMHHCKEYRRGKFMGMTVKCW